MFSILSKILQKKFIELFSLIPLKHCRIIKPYLLERTGISNGTAIMIAIPYFTQAAMDSKRNISAYAVSKDYHLYFAELFNEIIPQLKQVYPEYQFYGFADHSPIAEIDAAAASGLGIIGKNGLLITEKYSSYVFIGEIITDMMTPCSVTPIRFCENCNKCKSYCPSQSCGDCLSALTQKKGDLTDTERNHLTYFQSAWGCDICQEVCPHTQKAIENKTIFSPIPFFEQDPIAHVTTQIIDNMTDTEFSKRAYAWRGRETIHRNLEMIDDAQKKGASKC